MSQSAAAIDEPAGALVADLLPTCERALLAAERFVAEARGAVAALVMGEKGADPALLEQHQFAAHGYAWAATYATALREMLGWARRLEAGGRLGELEALMLQAAFGEYLGQMRGGIPLSQVEIVRPADMGLSDDAVRGLDDAAVAALVAHGNTNAARARIAALIADGELGDDGLEDETLTLVREQFRRFGREQVATVAGARGRVLSVFPPGRPPHRPMIAILKEKWRQRRKP